MLGFEHKAVVDSRYHFKNWNFHNLQIDADWTKMGLEQQQQCIQVTESQYHTGVQYRVPMCLAQAVRRHTAHHKLRFTCKSETSQK